MTYAFDPSRYVVRVPATSSHHDTCCVGDDDEAQTHSDGQCVQGHVHRDALALIAHQEQGQCCHQPTLK